MHKEKYAYIVLCVGSHSDSCFLPPFPVCSFIRSFINEWQQKLYVNRLDPCAK